MAKAGHVAWTPPSLPNSIVLLGSGVIKGGIINNDLTAETVPGKKPKASFFLLTPSGGSNFTLRHNRYFTCGIPVEEDIILTGGNYVTR